MSNAAKNLLICLSEDKPSGVTIQQYNEKKSEFRNFLGKDDHISDIPSFFQDVHAALFAIVSCRKWGGYSGEWYVTEWIEGESNASWVVR